MAVFTNAFLLSALLSHFAVDILNGQRAVLFTFLSVPLALTITQLGIYNTAYSVPASLIQPVFGYLTDRVGPRWMITGGLIWMGAFFAAGLLVPGVPGLLLLVVASLGSGAVHPAGAMQAAHVGKELLGGRETSSASYFFLFGQVGHFAGPLVSGLVLQASGAPGLLFVVAILLPVAVFSMVSAKTISITSPAPLLIQSQTKKREKTGIWVLVSLALLAGFQSWAQQNMISFLPKHLEILGKSPGEYGLLAALFMGGSAVGNVVGGNLADRFGKRRVASVSLSLAALPVLLIALLGWSVWLYLLIPLAGALTGATLSIILVLAQNTIPSGKGLASGLVMGFSFSAGALGAMFSGYLADLWGFPLMFGFTVLLVVAAAILTRQLPQA